MKTTITEKPLDLSAVVYLAIMTLVFIIAL